MSRKQGPYRRTSYSPKLWQCPPPPGQPANCGLLEFYCKNILPPEGIRNLIVYIIIMQCDIIITRILNYKILSQLHNQKLIFQHCSTVMNFKFECDLIMRCSQYFIRHKFATIQRCANYGSLFGPISRFQLFISFIKFAI